MGILSEKVAIVTGAAQGIGRAIAEEYAREGARVALADINAEEAERAALKLSEAGSKAMAVAVDVSDEHSVNALIGKVVDQFGDLDILVNNAGIYPRHVWHEMTAEQWDHIQGVNLRSCFLCARAAFPYFKKNGKGKIINISSVTFWVGAPQHLVHYIASKGGIIGFTRALARDVGEFHIQVNAITPGAVETEEERKVATPEQVGAIVAQQCLKSRVTPRDIARAAVFLASADSDMITGQTLNVDGGWAMH